MKWVFESSLAAVTRRSGKMTICSSLVAVTQWRRVGWRWGVCQGLHPQVCAARGALIQCSANRIDEIFADDHLVYLLGN
ncbi:unnamed protein product [Spirodela intermedia]|uniref:Uncharacterized protein n=1 Tax=Spirodela intermedia TaxID=51605 RepID=A0ABN7EA58_SPIIN|nr:unnamed protein product [Spirodela intermedia]